MYFFLLAIYCLQVFVECYSFQLELLPSYIKYIFNLSCIKKFSPTLPFPRFFLNSLQFVQVSLAWICQSQRYCSTCAIYSWLITSLEDNGFASVCSPKIILFSANTSPRLIGFPLLSLGFFSFLVLSKYLSPAEQLSLRLFFPRCMRLHFPS